MYKSATDKNHKNKAVLHASHGFTLWRSTRGTRSMTRCYPRSCAVVMTTTAGVGNLKCDLDTNISQKIHTVHIFMEQSVCYIVAYKQFFILVNFYWYLCIGWYVALRYFPTCAELFRTHHQGHWHCHSYFTIRCKFLEYSILYNLRVQ
jgi:hypothetical protein